MTVHRGDDTVLLEGVCAVEDAELLMQELQAGATSVDWSGCSHLHTACLQVLLATRIPVIGTPQNPALTHWLAPLFAAEAVPTTGPPVATPQIACLVEA